jgi:nucleotide-binding universal stress UspA family protein
MLRWKKVLVPHDLTETAEPAAALAQGLAVTHGADLVLLHVSPLPAGLGATSLIRHAGHDDAVTVEEFVTEGALRMLEERAANLRAQGVEVRTMARVGEVSETILEVARDERVDVIVMGTHGRAGLGRLILGSVAEKVVRQAEVPVVTVRTPPADTSTVAVPVTL